MAIPWGFIHLQISPGYCESGKHPMKLEDGSDAKGVLGESAIPFCGDGFEASGISECASDFFGVLLGPETGFFNG